MKLTIAELLTIDLKKYRNFCKKLAKWSIEELRDDLNFYRTMQEDEDAHCVTFKERLLKCRWMGAYAKAIEAELATR